MPTIGEIESMGEIALDDIAGLPTPRSSGVPIMVGHRLSVYWEDDKTW
jgi:hypothetical protein